MELMTIENVAKFFSVKGRATIDSWLFNGILPKSLTIKVGGRVFFVKEKLEEFLKTQYEQQLANYKSKNVVNLPKVVNL